MRKKAKRCHKSLQAQGLYLPKGREYLKNWGVETLLRFKILIGRQGVEIRRLPINGEARWKQNVQKGKSISLHSRWLMKAKRGKDDNKISTR